MYRSLKDFEWKDRSVFLRLDLNVPIDPVTHTISDDNRIRESLPTIQYLIEHEARIVIASHLGRPKKRDSAYSLEPVATHLATLLNHDVTLAEDCVGEGIELMIKGLKPKQVLLLENLRYYPGEETNDPVFATKLSRLCDIYITDAFGTAHRKHASTYGAPERMPNRGIGFLVEKELQVLNRLLENPEAPFYTLLGGSKVSDKLKTIESLLNRTQGLAIGGAMAFAFWAAQKRALPKGAREPSAIEVESAEHLLKIARDKGTPILLPTDTVESFDIGPRTVEAFAEFLRPAKTVFWNGPLGWFERSPYEAGTFAIARSLAAQTGTFKVAGGGDTVAAIHQAGASSGFNHLSTGGGAVLEYLEGNGLPGIDVLRTFRNELPIR